MNVYITHFDPSESGQFRAVLKKTVESIRKQRIAEAVRVIVVDDGSRWSREIAGDGTATRSLGRGQIREEPRLNDLDMDLYLVRNRGARLGKAPLLNTAVEQTDGEFLVFLDDDHPFLVPWALHSYRHLLSRYEFVLGRLLNGDYTARLFEQVHVQGTNFGLRRSTLTAIGGFGEHTERWGCGVDPDLFWRLYCRLKPERLGERARACFSGVCLTLDSVSGRWGSESDRDLARREFKEMYGVDMHENASREKGDWIEHRSCFPRLHESLWRRYNSVISRFKKN